MSSDAAPWLAGVDGCRGGWMVAFVRPSGTDIRLRVVSQFVDIVNAPETPQIIAIDMPIGLPERAGPGGREAERLIRPLLGERQSSVFSVPSRAAVYASDYSDACDVALRTSDPPRKVSKQTFNIAPKIREVDTVLRNDPLLATRVFEVHPELAFWQLNGQRALEEPKRVKSRPYAPGLALRHDILGRADLAPVGSTPVGASEDDLLDALACAAIARRLKAGLARSWPESPEMDAFGLKMAIWS